MEERGGVTVTSGFDQNQAHFANSGFGHGRQHHPSVDLVEEQATIRSEEIVPGYNGSNICAVLRFFIGPDYNQGTVFLKFCIISRPLPSTRFCHGGRERRRGLGREGSGD